MSRNGSGTYSLPAGNPVVTGTTISSTTHNSTMTDIANAITQSLSNDGQTVPVANIPMGGYKLTGLGAATTLGDAVRYEQLQPPLQPISASVGSNALTATLNPTTLSFRSATLGSGTVNVRNVAALISVVVPSSATLGTTNAIQSRIVVLAIDNAGTVELAVVNISGGNNLDETTLISTTAISAAATSASVIYSTTARSSVPFRVVGYIESTQATAGTWATAPSTIQGAGGNAISAMSSLGYGQTWQVVTGSRALSTTYTNTTGKPILLSIYWTAAGVTQGILTVSGGPADNAVNQAAAGFGTTRAVIPPGATYSFAAAGGTIGQWLELR